jgi:hypothetical protein
MQRRLRPSGSDPQDGALAQLGERLHGMQEVSGSIPLGSTILLNSSISFYQTSERQKLSAPPVGFTET